MGHIYFVRHGQSLWNVANKICGATDIDLTEKGHEQAIETGKIIKEGGYRIDEILCSPLLRAANTAKHISEIIGVPCRVEMALKEQNFGKYEGTPRDNEEFKAAKQEFINDYLKITGANILNDERSMLQDEIFFEFLNEKAIVSDDILKGFYFDNDFIGSQEIEVEI